MSIFHWMNFWQSYVNHFEVFRCPFFAIPHVRSECVQFAEGRFFSIQLLSEKLLVFRTHTVWMSSKYLPSHLPFWKNSSPVLDDFQGCNPSKSPFQEDAEFASPRICLLRHARPSTESRRTKTANIKYIDMVTLAFIEKLILLQWLEN